MSRTRKAEPKSHTTRLRRAPGSPGLGKPTLGIVKAIVTPWSARGARAQALLRRAARPDRCARRGCAGLRKADDTNPAPPLRAPDRRPTPRAASDAGGDTTRNTRQGGM